MYTYYSTNGNTKTLADEEAEKLMYQIHKKWKSDDTKFGKVFRPVYDLDEQEDSEETTSSTEKKILRNEKASQDLQRPIYGDCFVKHP